MPESDSDALVKKIGQFASKYYKNLFIITSRIAAANYIFYQQSFICVEVADFKIEQIAALAGNWFVAFPQNVETERKLENLNL